MGNDNEEIFERLHKTDTKCRKGEGKDDPFIAKDIISKKASSQKGVEAIIERLHRTHTQSSISLLKGPDPSEGAQARDIISARPKREDDINFIIDRLHTTHTSASAGEACKVPLYQPEPGPTASAEESKEIADRLHQTPTKSWTATECKPPVEKNPPGYGLKMFPIIDGLDTRFMGGQGDEAKVKEVIDKMHSTKTVSYQAKLDNPRHLLYPERTLLMNNFERITTYQASGALVKQAILQRREKWFN